MDKLEKLYQEMYELTLPACGKCPSSYSCCSYEYCSMALEYAKEKGVDLQENWDNDNEIPFLDKNKQCAVPPHLRPLCTLHNCRINGLGFNPEMGEKWNKKYFDLRNKIETFI